MINTNTLTLEQKKSLAEDILWALSYAEHIKCENYLKDHYKYPEDIAAKLEPKLKALRILEQKADELRREMIGLEPVTGSMNSCNMTIEKIKAEKIEQMLSGVPRPGLIRKFLDSTVTEDSTLEEIIDLYLSKYNPLKEGVEDYGYREKKEAGLI